MFSTPNPWTDEELLHTFLEMVVRYVYRAASESGEMIREAAADDDPSRLQDRLVELQVGAVVRILSIIDGTSAPGDWPGLELVNAETGKPLSNDLAWAFSQVEGDYLLAGQTPNQTEK